MRVLSDAVVEIMTQSGAISCAIVDIETGECLSRFGVAVTGTLEAAAIVNARMLRAKLRLADEQHHDTIEDVLITLDRHYHIIRLIHCGEGMPCMFIYLVLDRNLANLAIARRKLALIENQMVETPEAALKLEQSRSQALGLSHQSDKVYGAEGGFGSGDDDSELPPFMRDDVALKILGINVDEEIHET